MSDFDRGGGCPLGDSQEDLDRMDQVMAELDDERFEAAFAGEHPALTWAGHGRPAIGVWRGFADLQAQAHCIGQLVAIRTAWPTGTGAVDDVEQAVVTFEDGTRLALMPNTVFRMSPLAQGVSLTQARELLDAAAADVPEELAARLRTLRAGLTPDGQV